MSRLREVVPNQGTEAEGTSQLSASFSSLFCELLARKRQSGTVLKRNMPHWTDLLHNPCQFPFWIVPLSSVDKILRLCFTAENAEIVESSLFSFKFSAPAMS